MMSPSDAPVTWLAALAGAAFQFPRAESPRPYFSQRNRPTTPPESALPAIVRRIRALVLELHSDHYFADTLGFDCCDGLGDSQSSPEHELETRVGKPHLWTAEPTDWSEADLCDFVEVFHDIAARPTKGWFHHYSKCGWHPTEFSRRSGQALYRWRVNQLLNTTALEVRMAEAGEDEGRMVRSTPGQLGELIEAMLDSSSGPHESVAHAIALFRARDATREQRRSVIVALAGVLEQRRALLKTHLLSKDEGALFEIANRYDLRHQNADQRCDYDSAFLDWIYWYLATVQLCDQLLAGKPSRSSRGVKSGAP